ncbi:uncharacterized protein [Prorops nasuta]|uniref:uncharacterized protein n=1 Tax=Prorops nasuta TaxID=863751 RepID=UPI0034CDE3F8
MDGRAYYTISLEKQVVLTVWILAKAESFLAVGDRFNMSASSAHYCFKNVIKTLASITGTYIKWPNISQINNITLEFENRSHGIPGIIGAIDGCHIPIMQPHDNAVDYYNRKGFHSVILQGVCDHQRRFIDVHIGVPGRVHDARVFRTSPLYKNIMHHNLISPSNCIIGDSAYPLSDFVLVPYKDNGHLREERVRLNKRLSSVRSVIERAFALLKGKFPSACILHNFILIRKGYDVNDEKYTSDENLEEDDESIDATDNRGYDRRNIIARALS